jgi:hypothetical protein
MVSVNLVNNQIVYVRSKFFCLNFKCDRKDNGGKKNKSSVIEINKCLLLWFFDKHINFN